MKFYFLVLLMEVINKDSHEDCFRVGKRMKISHPRQPSYQVEEDKNPAFEIFDLKAHKEPEGIIWKFRNHSQYHGIKYIKRFLFIDKLKQHLALHNKQYTIINSELFSPLNIGKRVYNTSLYPILNIIWDSIIFFLLLTLNSESILINILIKLLLEVFEYFNDYSLYFGLDLQIDILKVLRRKVQQQQHNFQKLFKFINIFIGYVFCSYFSVLIVLDNEFIKIIGLILIKYIIFRKIILTFNKQLYFELSDLNLQIIQILLTCHYFTCINLRQEFILNKEVIDFEEIIGNYIEVYVNYILQFGNANSTSEGDTLLHGAFNVSTIAILFLQFQIVSTCPKHTKTKDLKRLQQFYTNKNFLDFKVLNFFKVTLNFSRDENSQNIENYFEQSLAKESLFQEFKEQKLINFVNQFAIFSKFSKSTKQQIAQNLTPIVLNSNDKLICNQYGDQYTIYLLYQGKVACGLTDTIQEYHQIFSGQCFGQYSFFTGQENKNLIKCLDYCLLYKLNRENFLKIISSNVKDLEIANFIKDQILFNNNYSIIDSICLYCQDKTHLINNCPKVHLIKRRLIFDQYLYCSDQPRMLCIKLIQINRQQKKNEVKISFEIILGNYMTCKQIKFQENFPLSQTPNLLLTQTKILKKNKNFLENQAIYYQMICAMKI